MVNQARSCGTMWSFGQGIAVVALSAMMALSGPALAAPPGADAVARFLAGETNDCPDCDLTLADLRRRDLRGANLSGAKLVEADLFSADLSGADLRRADLSTARVPICGVPI